MMCLTMAVATPLAAVPCRDVHRFYLAMGRIELGQGAASQQIAGIPCRPEPDPRRPQRIQIQRMNALGRRRRPAIFEMNPKKIGHILPCDIVDPNLHCSTRAAFYGLSVSRNRTGSPVDGVTSSPCHITRRPRTKVPTGHPVTFTPSYGVQPAREATHLLVMVSLRLRSTIVKSAS